MALMAGFGNSAALKALLNTTSASLFSLGYAKLALMKTSDRRMERRRSMSIDWCNMDIRTLLKRIFA